MRATSYKSTWRRNTMLYLILLVLPWQFLGLGCNPRTDEFLSSETTKPDRPLKVHSGSYKFWKLPTESRAHIWRETLTVEVAMCNTTGKELIILPSLLATGLGDSTYVRPGTDIVGVMFYGMKEKWKAPFSEGIVGYDKNYRLQFVLFEPDSTITFIYRIPCNLYQLPFQMAGMKFLHALEFPVWYASDTLLHRLVTQPLRGQRYIFSNTNVPKGGVRFSDPWVVNIGTASWRGSVNVSEHDFYRLSELKAGCITDSSSISMMVVSNGQQKPKKPVHISFPFKINEQQQTAIHRAEHEAQK